MALTLHRQIGQSVAEGGASLACGDAKFVQRLHVFSVKRTAGRMIERGIHVRDAQREVMPLRADGDQHQFRAQRRSESDCDGATEHAGNVAIRHRAG